MRLEKGIELTDYDYKIHVVNNDQVNAFATIAGHLFVNTGFIEFVETPEEIVAVLAHEIGHIEHRHVIRKLVKELGIAIVFGVLTGDNGEFVSDMSRAMLSTGFDRGQEADADNFAFDLLTKVNLKPTHIATFFRRLKRKDTMYQRLWSYFLHIPIIILELNQLLSFLFQKTSKKIL